MRCIYGAHVQRVCGTLPGAAKSSETSKDEGARRTHRQSSSKYGQSSGCRMRTEVTFVFHTDGAVGFVSEVMEGGRREIKVVHCRRNPNPNSNSSIRGNAQLAGIDDMAIPAKMADVVGIKVWCGIVS
jgi:hypothetical protein